MRAEFIREHWYAVLESTELSSRKPLVVRRLGLDLVFFRDGEGRVVCMPDNCPHRNASFALGKVENGTLACPFHGFRFDARGNCVHMPSSCDGRIPGNYAIRTFPVREAQGLVWLWYGEPRDDLPDVPWFDEIDGSYRWATNRSEWRCHFALVLEASFDPAHGPFVHRRSLGRFIHPVQRPSVDASHPQLRTVLEQGSPLRQIPDFFVKVGFPNVLMSQQAKRLILVWIAAPVDADRTVVYFRNYQNMVRVPILGDALCKVQALANKILVAEDVPVLEHIREPWDPYTKDQRLVAADSMVSAYRALWRRRMKEVGAMPSRALPQHSEPAGTH